MNQMDLFKITTRDEGREKVEWAKGGIETIHLERFKRFKDFRIDFDRITLLVGTNSSGKTSILQAIRLFFWCILKCAKQERNGYRFTKAVIPFGDFHLIPAHELRELCFQGISPNSRDRAIILNGKLRNGLELSFRIYASYTTLMVIDPVLQPKTPLSELQLSQIDRPPLYIPGFFGVVTRELLAHEARLEELLNSGHHNEVLRNIYLRLKSDKARLRKLLDIISKEFSVDKIELPFSDKTTEFLKAEYKEPKNRIPFDFVSAGSGFLQVLQIMAHALQNPSPILLLDEPDAHMHHNLQKSFLKILRQFSDEEDLQVIMASHSETFLREASLPEIRVIDSLQLKAGKFPSPIDLEEELSKVGIWPSHLELAEILRTKRVLLLEGSEDENCIFHLGKLIYSDWGTKSRLVQIVYSEGSNDNTIKRLEYVRKILSDIMPDGIKVAHLRDRDLLCDEAVNQIRKLAREKGLPLNILNTRNRESIFIEPVIVEKAVKLKYQGNLPSELKSEGSISKLAHEVILKWCNEELDELPVKIQEYNRSWVYNNFDASKRREGEKFVASFLRESWTEPISKNKIPWKLVDGKTVLRAIRKSLQKYKIVLSEEDLLNAMGKDDFDRDMIETVKMVYEWFQK
ncbi:MAG: AAA family ATPase [Candidatus Lokiarchaeota archaeon]|nr:AAA family ATPase [Candidatus Lokiarchaeota archaeon]